MINPGSQRLAVWIDAIRPQTLPAAIVPVIVGAGLAFRMDSFSWSASAVALLSAMLIQIGTNFANDYFDYVKGADTNQRVGFQRATASGLITGRQMWNATILTMSVAFLTGIYLVWIAGWPILIIGVLSIVCGIAYTGGPLPLGYNGLGDIFVFLFFGIIAVMGTFYVNALQWSWHSFICSLPIGSLSTNILVVNNLRDIKEDRNSGKKTLGVLFGSQFLKMEYTIFGIFAMSVPIFMMENMGYSIWILLPLLSLPMGIYLTKRIWTEEDRGQLNPLLEMTGQWMSVYGVLFAVAVSIA